MRVFETSRERGFGREGTNLEIMRRGGLEMRGEVLANYGKGAWNL